MKESPYPDLVIPEVPAHEFILERMKQYDDDVALIKNRKGEAMKESPYPDLVIPEVPAHEFILERMKQYDDDVALVDFIRGTTITFSEICRQVTKCSNGLYKHGLRKSDVVAICAENRIEYAVILLAVGSCGGVTTTCDPQCTEGEILQQLKVSQPKMVFCESQTFSLMKNITKDLQFAEVVYTFGEVPDTTSYTALLKCGGSDAFPPVSIDPKNDLFMVPYSSGTTGPPKGIMLTHYNVVARINLLRITCFTSRCSCHLTLSPLFHGSGYAFLLQQLTQGAKNVIAYPPQVDKILQVVEKHKVTHIFAVSSVMLKLLQTDLFDQYDTTSVGRLLIGSASTAPSLITAFSKRYDVAVSQIYGLTEIVPVTQADPIVQKLESVGTIVPNTSVKVISTETGAEMGTGEDGEILVKGPHLMKGYFRNPDATAKSIDKDGWLHTGDYGHYDKNGMLYCVDRLKEMIYYKGGFHVSPTELESLLLTHPGVSDAAVVGIPDTEAVEVPKAFIVKRTPSLTALDVQNFVKKAVSHNKRLRGGVEFLDVIPRTPTGKILRRELKERARKTKA